MENIRKYYREMKRLLSRKRLSNRQVNIEAAQLANISLDGIKNKLLSMPINVRPQYAKFIVDAINNEVSMFEYTIETELDYGYLLSLDLDYLYQLDYSHSFPLHITGVFEEFGIEIKHEIQEKDNSYHFQGLKLENYQSNNNTEVEVNILGNRKEPKATLAQQWVIIRNLMECATGWKLTNDSNQLMYNKTDVAKFISFLCGGSEDRIRKHLEDELAAKDVNEILPYLENIGLHEISNRIKKDAK